MTKLVRGPNKQGVAQAGTSLFWDYPYDSTTMTSWRLDGEDADIRHFFVTLTLTGNDREEVAAVVSVKENGSWIELAKRDSKVLSGGDSFFLRGNLPRALEVQRSDGSCDAVYTFTYADAHDPKDSNRFFKFDSDVDGFGKWSRPPFKGKGKNHREPYCLKKPLSKRKSGNSSPTVYGTEIACEFPGW